MAPKFSKALKAKKFATAAAKRATVASSMSSTASRVTKPVTKVMGMEMGSMSSSTGKWINWILIIALVALLVFTIVYVINIHKMATRMEGFIDDIAVAESTVTPPVKAAAASASVSGYKLVYMYSKTCPHCVEFTPTFDEFTRQLSTHSLAGKVSVEKIERSDANAAAYLKMVEGFPSVLLIKDNELKEMMVGKTDLATIKTFVEKNAI